jgi:cation transporter-like permease
LRSAIVVMSRPTMLRLRPSQRSLLAEKTWDLANLAAGALVFGQFLADRFSVLLAVAGLLVWVPLEPPR